VTTEVAGDGFVLRSWQEADKPSLVKHANNRRIWRNMSDAFPYPYSGEAAERWIRKAQHPSRDGTHLAIVIGGEAAGGIGMDYLTGGYRKTAEVGYWLGEQHWGQGIATKVLRAYTRYAFDRYDIERLHARVFEWNPGSCKVLERAAYTFEGIWRRACIKDDQFSDVYMYSFIRPDLPKLEAP